MVVKRVILALGLSNLFCPAMVKNGDPKTLDYFCQQPETTQFDDLSKCIVLKKPELIASVSFGFVKLVSWQTSIEHTLLPSASIIINPLGGPYPAYYEERNQLAVGIGALAQEPTIRIAQIALLDLATNTYLQRFASEDFSRRLFVSKQKQLIAVNMQNIKIWDINSGKKIKTIDASSYSMSHELLFNAKANTLISTGSRRLIEWNLDTEQIKDPFTHFPAHIESFCFLDHKNKIAVATNDSVITTKEEATSSHNFGGEIFYFKDRVPTVHIIDYKSGWQIGSKIKSKQGSISKLVYLKDQQELALLSRQEISALNLKDRSSRTIITTGASPQNRKFKFSTMLAIPNNKMWVSSGLSSTSYIFATD